VITDVGKYVGSGVALLGGLVGSLVLLMAGRLEGCIVGFGVALVGRLDGVVVGCLEGCNVGSEVGRFVAVVVGCLVGSNVGSGVELEGCNVGSEVGRFVGVVVGCLEGSNVGSGVECLVGTIEGCTSRGQERGDAGPSSVITAQLSESPALNGFCVHELLYCTIKYDKRSSSFSFVASKTICKPPTSSVIDSSVTMEVKLILSLS